MDTESFQGEGFRADKCGVGRPTHSEGTMDTESFQSEGFRADKCGVGRPTHSEG
jgi:hypothetical protein